MDRLKFERECLKDGYSIVAGVDECGVGSLAGPLYAAAVILNWDSDFSYSIRDSKKLTERIRKILCEEIQEKSIAWTVGICTVEEVDKFNPKEASKIAMQRAVDGLFIKPDFLLIDYYELNKDIPNKGIQKGDDKSLSIGAASIVAKHIRDQVMVELSKEYPWYDWGNNKGYGTPVHKSAILKYGITKYHRRSYKCVEQAYHKKGFCDISVNEFEKQRKQSCVIGKISW